MLKAQRQDVCGILTTGRLQKESGKGAETGHGGVS